MQFKSPIPRIPKQSTVSNIASGLAERARLDASYTHEQPRTKAKAPTLLASQVPGHNNVKTQFQDPIPRIPRQSSIIGGLQHLAETGAAQSESRTVLAANRLIADGKFDTAQQILGGELPEGAQKKMQAKKQGEDIANAIGQHLDRVKREAEVVGLQHVKDEDDAPEDDDNNGGGGGGGGPDVWDWNQDPNPGQPPPMYFDERLGRMVVGVPPHNVGFEDLAMPPLEAEDDDHFPVHYGGSARPQYDQVGAIEFHRGDLGRGILNARYKHNKHKIASIPNMQVRPHMKHALIALTAGHGVSTDGLSPNEAAVLGRLDKASKAKARGARKEPVLRQLRVMAGERQAGNDNRAMDRQFEQQLRVACERGTITTQQARALSRTARLPPTHKA